MAFNKNKALESALKFLNQGKVAQAIGEYQQILRHDPKDQATLMTVGDLFARQADMPQAIEYFERLAQVYLHDGFNSKAIAIYKKIAKLAPNELAPLERLADLYVQQGVLSEARPLFLQIAEAHLKANRAPKAVEVLHRVLDVEPDNPRVQMRLAELYNVMGQKKEAAQTYLSYAQRLFDNGEGDEAEKMIDRALAADPGSANPLLLKAKILVQKHKNDAAIALLEKMPDAEAGGEVTSLLIDLEITSGHVSKATSRARSRLARGSKDTALFEKLVGALFQAGKANEALPLLRELRDPMIEASEQDKFLKLLLGAVEKLPNETEPLEMLADFARHTSDPFQLNAALSELADIYAAAGNYPRAEELLQELVERNKDDERFAARLQQILGRSGPHPPSPVEEELVPPGPAGPANETAPAANLAATFLVERPEPLAAAKAEDPLDEETQRYIAQALTDVDLFSSYGLTQKATNLLENVLKRAPRHAPTLERLLDFYLGAGDERRTAELAAQLEQIHIERGDTTNAERFTELRERFQRRAAVTTGNLQPSSPPSITRVPGVSGTGDESATPRADAATPAVPAEFEIPLVPVETRTAAPAAHSPTTVPSPAQPMTPELAATVPPEEVDLSDEWEAMVREVGDDVPFSAKETAGGSESVDVPAESRAESIGKELPAPQVEPPEEIGAAKNQAEETGSELSDPKLAEAPTAEDARAGADFELELTPASGQENVKMGPATTEDFLSDLAAEVEDMELPLGASEATAKATPASAAGPILPTSADGAGNVTAEALNELAEVFQEFRNELGEGGGEGEDLETHYNLGIAYREMGLLDEAIGEFQKVAKAVKQGKPFQYAMNCSTLLALSFMDKGEPRIAALWYQQALDLPGLEQETIMALRYDLGVSLDMAGEADAALDNFRQVYAMNIDYRDVSDRIATLQKH